MTTATPSPARVAAPAATGQRAGLRQAVRAEWTKLRSLRGTTLASAATVGLTVMLSAFTCAAVSTAGGPGGDEDVVFLSLSGVYLGQVPMVALAVMAVATEYTTGMIRTTLVANPRRGTVLAAKLLVTGTIAAGVGLVASVGSFLAGQSILPGNGFTAANGYPPATLAQGPALRAVAGTALYLTLLALLSLGIGAILRHSAGAVTTMLVLLYLPLIAATFLPSGAREALLKAAPMTAGLAVQVTTPDLELVAGQGSEPIGPLAGIGLLASYTAVTLLLAFWLMARRDA
jgi:ABC-2 type transport system permease protein